MNFFKIISKGISYLLFSVLLILFSCENALENDIIGKWEIIEIGYYDFNDSLIMEDVLPEEKSGYVEFRPNNKKIHYRYIDGNIYSEEYKVRGDKLYENYKNSDKEEIRVYTIKFIDDKLCIEYFSGTHLYTYPFYSISVYERIK